MQEEGFLVKYGDKTHVKLNSMQENLIIETKTCDMKEMGIEHNPR